MPDAYELARYLRSVDGDHTLSSSKLAEAILDRYVLGGRAVPRPIPEEALTELREEEPTTGGVEWVGAVNRWRSDGEGHVVNDQGMFYFPDTLRQEASAMLSAAESVEEEVRW
jgi:hypothetical protein